MPRGQSAGVGIAEIIRICLFLFDNRMLGPYLAAINRILISAMMVLISAD
jgi:hypothetical protein